MRSFSKMKNINIGKYKEFKATMEALKGEKGKAYDYVVIDSLTSLFEILDKYCRTVFSGYTIWSEYNDHIYDALQMIKELPQQVFITAIPEQIEIKPNEFKSVAKVKGKQWVGAIEKEFSVVLHTDLTEDEEGNITEYRFDTKPSKYTSAKTPFEMFDERYIPNDMKYVADQIQKYYEGD